MRFQGQTRLWVMVMAAGLSLSPAKAATPASSPNRPHARMIAPVHLDNGGERWAKTTLRKMSLEEKIGQMIMVWARVQYMNVRSAEYLRLRDEMRTYHIGGFGMTVPVDGALLIKSEPLEAAALTNGLQRDSKYPLLFAADFERGLSVRLNGATPFPAAMAFGAAGDAQLARQYGRISAEEARAIGVQWNWFPVADVNSNPANPIIHKRSFGGDPAQVGKMVAAYIDGARSEGLLTTVKHFPGHGDTDTDSHLTLARSNASMDRLNSLELVPFRAAIAAHVDTVMVAHITVPAIEPDPNRPASISANVITDLLKQKLGFKGLVVTDALDMGALMRAFPGSDAEVSGAEAVEAIRAGNDMVIIPANLDGAYNGLLDAVRHGTITRARINESVLKILRLKASVGLNRNRLVDPEAVMREVGKPESLTVAQTISDRAVTLASDAHGLVPLRHWVTTGSSAPRVVAVVFTDDARGSEGGRAFARELRRRNPDAKLFFVDDTNATSVSHDVLAAAAGDATVVAVAEAVPTARRTTQGQAKGSAGLDHGSAQLLTSLVNAAGPRTVVVAFGNPYIGANVPGIATYLCTFSNSAASAMSLVEALFGELPIHGRLPVTIPGIAEIGTGLDRDAVKPVTH